MDKSTDLLNDLIEIARDGRQFYLDAAGRAQDPEMRQVFNDQAELRGQLVDDLSGHVAHKGETASQDETLAGRTRKLYAAVLAAISRDREGVYVAQLGEVEDRMLAHYRRAMDEVESEDVRRILVGYLPTVETAHDRMKRLQQRKMAA